MNMVSKMVTRATKIAFILGVILLCAGIVIAAVAPAAVTWEPKSKTLADKETLAVSPKWKTKTESLIDKVITVELWETYDYWFASAPFIFGEAKDFVVSGTATEQSSPQRWFNFYVFDSVNFDLWKAGASYIAYYEVKGITYASFTISISRKEDVPTTFYFVVEEHVIGVKPTVRVTATISWAEQASILDSSAEFSSLPPLIIEESKDFVLRGNATEVSGYRFNFYIMNLDNYMEWTLGKAYTAYFEQKNVTETSFTIQLTKGQATSAIYFVVENPLRDVNETVKISATLEWQEKATIAATLGGWILGGIIAVIGLIIIIVAGIATLIFKPKPKA
jgi:hypothetical protein